MKIIHFADLHLGVETYGRTDPETGQSTRLLEFLKALDYLVDYALDNGADLVLFCGDAYKSREPTQTQQREFAKRIRRLSAGGIPLFLLIGNHDLPTAPGRATATEIFDTLAVEKVTVAGKPDVYPIQTRSGVLQVVSLPWPRRSNLLAREDTKNLDLKQLTAKMEQILSDTVAQNCAKLDKSLPAVLAGHVWVMGARTGTESAMTIGQEHMLLASAVTHPALDYTALGHIHRHQVVRENQPVVYAGSLARLDFGDEEDEKGFYVIDIEPSGAARQVRYQFHPVPARRFLKIEVAINPQDADSTAAVLQAVAEREAEIKDAIVRVNINLTSDKAASLRDNELREVLKSAHNFNITREIQRDTRTRLGNLPAEGLTPLDALKKWLDTQKNTPEHRASLLDYGEKLITGQETKN